MASTTETTDAVAAAGRWTFWKDTAMAPVDGIRLDATSTFSARRIVTPLSCATLADTSSGPVACQRSTRNIARDGDDGVCLMMLLEGQGVADQRELGGHAVSAGDLALFDLARPHGTMVLTPHREMRLHIPRAVFEARVGAVDRAVALRITAADPLASLFSAHLVAVAGRLAALSANDADVAMDGVLHLLSGFVASRSEPRRGHDEQLSGDAVLELAQRQIEALSNDAALDVAMLARATGASRSRLYRAFAGQGGVGTAIRSARLEASRLRLSTPVGRQRTLEKVARSCGFDDDATFSRAVRRRFGLSPTESTGPMSQARARDAIGKPGLGATPAPPALAGRVRRDGLRPAAARSAIPLSDRVTRPRWWLDQLALFRSAMGPERVMGVKSEDRLAADVEALSAALGHANRRGPFRDHCFGLLMPVERESVEPLAAVTAPGRTPAQHQSSLHVVGQGRRSDQCGLTSVWDQVHPHPCRCPTPCPSPSSGRKHTPSASAASGIGPTRSFDTG